MTRIVVIAMYVLLWTVWLLWALQFLELTYVFGGSYWIGLPAQEASLIAWLMWPFLFALLYLLPIVLLVAPALLARQRRR
jgi:hypothetical protein